MAHAPAPISIPSSEIIEYLQSRDPWTAKRGLRLAAKAVPGIRRVTDSIPDIETRWHHEAVSALTGSDPIWIVMGDSLAQGVGTTDLASSWVARVGAALATAGQTHGIVNLSRSGATTADVLNDQLPLLRSLNRAPALITVTVGSNDSMQSAWPGTVVHRMRSLVAQLPTGTVISTLPAPRFSVAGQVINRAVRAAAAEHDLGLADVVPNLVLRGGTASDLFHPSDKGYQAWVTAFGRAFGLPDEALGL